MEQRTSPSGTFVLLKYGELHQKICAEIEIRKEEINQAKDTLVDCAERAADLHDRASNHEACEEARRTKDRAEGYLARLEARKYEIEHGIFDGCCEECGEEINPHRLLAQPTTKKCTPCREALERRRAGRYNGQRYSFA